MPVELPAPACMHVAELTENESAAVNWSIVDGAEAYRVRRYLEGTAALSETDLDRVVYDGPGIPWPNPDQGMKWEQMDSYLYTWTVFEATLITWEMLKQFFIPGLTWTHMLEYWLSWEELEPKRVSWEMIETRAHNADHIGFVDQLPRGARSARYRVLAYNGLAQSTDRETDPLPVALQLIQDNESAWQVEAGRRYLLQIDGALVDSFDKNVFTLEYDGSALRLLDLSRLTPGSELEPGEYPDAGLEILSATDGELRFSCRKNTGSAGERWNGNVTLAQFLALQTGETRVSLK